MSTIIAISALLLQTFHVATVKPSAHAVGRDYRGRIVFDAGKVSARNVSLKQLIVEAYAMQPYQVSGPGWLDADEFDLDARVDGAHSKNELRAMLRTLLSGRFALASHTDTRDVKAYVLVADKPKLRPGDMEMPQLTQVISVQLSIAAPSDPSRPSMAAKDPVPVIDRTGLTGSYDLHIRVTPDGSDMFVLWQHALQDVGLKLESQKTKAEFLVVDRAQRIPLAN